MHITYNVLWTIKENWKILQKVKKVLTALLTTVSTRFIVLYGPFGNILLGAYQNHDQFFRSSG